MLRALREMVKRSPFGPVLHDMYLRAFRSEGETLTISGGALAGRKWARFMRTHNDQYVSGAYEREVQNAIIGLLKPGMTFYDVGANAGFFPCWQQQSSGRADALFPLNRTQKLRPICVSRCSRTISAMSPS
jgi:hypothetical protein